MGCQVVSVYADQANGVIGYPEQINTDLYNRNYTAGNLLKTVPNSHQYDIYGFNQSYAQAKLFTIILSEKEYFVYSSGRFLIIEQSKSLESKQKSLMHEDKIIGIDMKGKLCLVGLVGGRLILWDLQYMEQKLNIKAPEPTVNFSSLSLTSSYIFCTNTQQPHNQIFCYDIRTAKLKAKSFIPTYENTLKGANWGISHHVTVSSDGVWFSKYSENTKQFEIVKGMFRIFPKTSMTCVSAVDETYVITGSVDGYIFLWAFYQCQKVMKVGDACVTDMLLNKNKLIVSNLAENIRVFQYTIKKKAKLEEDEQKNGEITDDFVSVIIDSYQRQPLQSISISKSDESIYYSQTRTGLMFNKMIPSAEYRNKINYYKDMDKRFIQFQREATKYIYNQFIWQVKYSKPFFMVKKLNTSDLTRKWRVQSNFISNAKKYIEGTDSIHYCFIPQLQQICYFGVDKAYIVNIVDIEKNEDIKIDNIEEQVILQFQPKGPNRLTPRGVSSFLLEDHTHVVLFFEAECMILKREKEISKWATVLTYEYDKQIQTKFEIGGKSISFEERSSMFREIRQLFGKQIKEKMAFMHCVHEIDDIGKNLTGKILSLGGSFALLK